MEETPVSRSGKWRERLRMIARGGRKILPFTGGVVAAFIALFLYNLIFPGPQPLNERDVKDTINSVLASATPPPAYSEQVYRVIQPSLVLIITKGTDEHGKDNSGLGSGVIIDDAGDILTSLHVVAGATSIELTFADGSKSAATVITKTPESDTAVLKADTPPAVIVPATLGNPNAMQVGDEAYVVGNPFGLYGSMSAGVISGFGRSFQPEGSQTELKGLIQIDTAVNPGNSGGPLLNRYGQVIGLVEGIVNPTGQDVFIGIGFAVPINAVGGGMGSPVD
jgi:S1-C subfamily serine protease